MFQVIMLTVNYALFDRLVGSFSNSVFSIISMVALGGSSLYYMVSLYHAGWLLQEKQGNLSEYCKQKEEREEKIKSQNSYGLMLTVACFLLVAVAWMAGESTATPTTQTQQGTQQTK